MHVREYISVRTGRIGGRSKRANRAKTRLNSRAITVRSKRDCQIPRDLSRSLFLTSAPCPGSVRGSSLLQKGLRNRCVNGLFIDRSRARGCPPPRELSEDAHGRDDPIDRDDELVAEKDVRERSR